MYYIHFICYFAAGMMTIPVSIYQSLMASQQQGTLDMSSAGQVVFTQAATTQQVQQPHIITQQQLEQLQQQQTLQQHLVEHQEMVQQDTDQLGVQLAPHQLQGTADSVDSLITAGSVVHKTEPA